MPVTFILGRAGAGKTRYCLDALAAELERPDEDRRLILLVPEQASLQMERALALRSPRHGYWRAEVLSFSRLAHRVLGEAGGSAEILNAHARTMALRRLVAADVGSLRVFGAAAGTHGLFAQLDRLFEELLLENVSPETLTETAAGLDDGALRRKLGAVGRLYTAYLAWLGCERIDPAQQLAVLRERLASTTWLRAASIWVDGFSGFTGQDAATLVALARQAREMAITLLVDPQSPAVVRARRTPDPLDLFHRTATTYQRLLTLLTEAGVELRAPVRLQPQSTPRFQRTPTVARLETALALPVTVPLSNMPQDEADPRDVRILECPTHREELRQAARFIRQSIIESRGALRFRDFAVIARDLEPFAELVAEVFDEYGIPYFLDRRRPMPAHALTRLVQALLEALAGDFPVTATTRLLSSGLLPLTREHAEQLHNTIVEHQVRGIAAWQRPHWNFERRTPPPRRADLDAARLRVVAAITPPLELAGAAAPPAGAEWAQRLYAAVETLGVRERIEEWIAEARQQRAWETAELHRLAWDAFRSVLADLHEVLGETPLRVAEVAEIVSSAMDEATLGLAPPTLDQVLVGAIERTRHPEIQHAWVFAFNEGVFPAPPPEDRLLSTAERDALTKAGLDEIASRRDDVFAERLLAYIAFTRPAQGLTISYAEASENGEPRFPSPLLDEVRRALPELRIEQPDEDAPPTCLAELARGFLSAHADEVPQQHAAIYEQLCTEFRSPELERRLRGLTYRNACSPIGNYRGDNAANVVWNCSPSEVEKYLQCPFKHFADYGLRLGAPRGPTRLELELGRAAHEILATVTRRAIAAAGSVRDLSDEQWSSFLHDALEQSRQDQPDDLAHRQPQLAFLTDVLGGQLHEVVLAHAERWRRGRFEPLACEQEFRATGAGGVWPPLELEIGGGGLVRLRGKIDRVDRCRQGGTTYLLAYDYKSSSTAIGAAYLTQDRLQLFTYLLALGQAFIGEPGLRLAGALLAPLYPDLSVLNNKYAGEADEPDQRLYLYRPRGLFDAAAARLLDEQLGEQVSPVAQMRLKKDGGFYANSDAKSGDELQRRLELARRTILHAATGVAEGRIDIAPLVENQRLACNFCDFRPVCRFERVFNRPRAAERTLPVLHAMGDGARGDG